MRTKYYSIFIVVTVGFLAVSLFIYPQRAISMDKPVAPLLMEMFEPPDFEFQTSGEEPHHVRIQIVLGYYWDKESPKKLFNEITDKQKRIVQAINGF